MTKDGGKSTTQARILASAREHFARRGYRRTTIEAIAAGAGVATGTVLWHFGHKSVLYERVVRSVADRFLRSMQQRAQDERTSLSQMIEEWVGGLAADHPAGALLVSAVRDPEDLVGGTGSRLKARFVEFWLDWLRQLEARHSLEWTIQRKTELAHMIVAVVSGLQRAQFSAEGTRSLGSLVEEFARVVEAPLKGLRLPES